MTRLHESLLDMAVKSTHDNLTTTDLHFMLHVYVYAYIVVHDDTFAASLHEYR